MKNLVLIPGLNNTGAVFDGVVRALPPGITAYTPTLPAIDSVDALARGMLANLPERFWLAGFSFGGYVALALLAAAPERVQGIALLCSAPQADAPAGQGKRLAAIQKARTGGYHAMIDAQAGFAFHPDSLQKPELMQARRAMVQSYGPERYVAHATAAMARPDRSALLNGDRPTLVLAASHDKVFPPAGVQQYATAIPGAHYVQVQGAGHLVPMERPQQVAQALAAWVLTP
jgi:pimeloyl-ACP methyl ester carboxylesterase